VEAILKLHFLEQLPYIYVEKTGWGLVFLIGCMSAVCPKLARIWNKGNGVIWQNHPYILFSTSDIINKDV
jgi:hypothetical protein